MAYPQIFLAIDNCFACKRWTEPRDWARVIGELGVSCIEASADTELDPLFMGPEYLNDWVGLVKDAEKEYGVKVVNLYSGHGTYSTLGLTHTDARVRKRMLEDWFKPLVEIAARLDAGLGFFAHGFSERVLLDPTLYAQYVEILLDSLAKIAVYAKQSGCGLVGLEQMYAPHLVPWRLDETLNLMKDVTRRAGHPFYVTEDLGHHHMKFIRPSRDEIARAIASKAVAPWLVAPPAYALYESAVKGEIEAEAAVSNIESILDSYPHMFTVARDGDCYEWLRELGCYSPIIHLQQTNGLQSVHLHFTEANNAVGIIDPPKVLKALKESYDAPAQPGMPPKVDKVYLTLEAFSGTTNYNYEILTAYKESVDYWRRFVPKDGVRLDELSE